MEIGFVDITKDDKNKFEIQNFKDKKELDLYIDKLILNERDKQNEKLIYSFDIGRVSFGECILLFNIQNQSFRILNLRKKVFVQNKNEKPLREIITLLIDYLDQIVSENGFPDIVLVESQSDGGSPERVISHCIQVYFQIKSELEIIFVSPLIKLSPFYKNNKIDPKTRTYQNRKQDSVQFAFYRMKMNDNCQNWIDILEEFQKTKDKKLKKIDDICDAFNQCISWCEKNLKNKKKKKIIFFKFEKKKKKMESTESNRKKSSEEKQILNDWNSLENKHICEYCLTMIEKYKIEMKEYEKKIIELSEKIENLKDCKMNKLTGATIDIPDHLVPLITKLKSENLGLKLQNTKLQTIIHKQRLILKKPYDPFCPLKENKINNLNFSFLP